MANNDKARLALSMFVTAYEAIDERIVAALGSHIAPLQAAHKAALAALIELSADGHRPVYQGNVDMALTGLKRPAGIIVSADDHDFYVRITELMESIKDRSDLSLTLDFGQTSRSRQENNAECATLFLREWSFQGERPQYKFIARLDIRLADRLHRIGVHADGQPDSTRPDSTVAPQGPRGGFSR